jgi:glycogen debranching enzyme
MNDMTGSPGKSAALVEETPFYIAATGAANRPRQSLKWGDAFLVLDNHGDAGAAVGEPDGLFYRDTRFLSQLELAINDLQPMLLGSSVRDDNTVATSDLTNPDIVRGGKIVLQKDTLHIVRTTFLWRETAFQRIGIRNHGRQILKLDVRIRFDSDFADLFEVRGMKRKRRGVRTAATADNHRVVLSYQGLDSVVRRTTLSFDPAPLHLAQAEASYRVTIAPGDTAGIFLSIGCDTTEVSAMPFAQALIGAHRDRREMTAEMATVETSNDLLNEMLCRSAADLSMLITETPQGPYPYAGIPWYSTTFGRDGIITALQMLWFAPKVARGVLRRLAFLQAKTENAAADAQPGKILHEMRGGEMAALGEVPFQLYYGTVDATPLFVLLAGAYLARTNDVETIAELWPAIEAALNWIDRFGDADGDGFVEYRRATEEGLANQGWKDSFDAIFRADGSLVEGDVALAEVQGYVFAAKRAAARCAEKLGKHERAGELERQAIELQKRFEEAFWCPDLNTYALALDGAKTPCRVVSSNAGQVLFSGIAREDRAKRVAATMLGPQSFSGWGIRTIAKGMPRYNPMSYHNGSVWPHDNALIALGFARYGLAFAVERLFNGLFHAASYMELRRLPELFCGFQRQKGRGPTLYPVACSPQAWASATLFTLVEASLGLELDPVTQEIRLRNPRLPAFLDDILLRNLRLGTSRVDIRIRRARGQVALDVVRSEGPVQVSVVLSN